MFERSREKCSKPLLPTRSEEREVLGVGSIHVAILPSCQDIKIIALYLHKHEYSWVVKIRNTSEAISKDSLVRFTDTTRACLVSL